MQVRKHVLLLKKGYRVILVNSNPATIMTDKEIADKVYIEPLTHDFMLVLFVKSNQMHCYSRWTNWFKYGNSTPR